MGKPKHTPGPWILDRDKNFGPSIRTSNGDPVAVARESHNEAWMEMTDEDGCLMTAAPDMYDALKAALKYGLSDTTFNQITDAIKLADEGRK